jgi:hypothetical protein
VNEYPIPEDLKQRYENLASYKPMEVAVTNIYVRDWLVLIERIARLEAQLTAMTVDRNLWQDAHNDDCPNKAMLDTALAKYERMSAPVSDEEWGISYWASDGGMRGFINTFVAARAGKVQP